MAAGRTKALGVLLLREAEPPEDHQRDRQQCQDRRDQAGQRGHWIELLMVLSAQRCAPDPSFIA